MKAGSETSGADRTRVRIYTDGACSGNPGPGGWGAVLLYKSRRKEIFGGEADTTNNRMELTAAIRALDMLKRRSSVDLYTDSRYVRDGISQWIHAWKAKGWRRAGKKPVKNADLWRLLDRMAGAHEVRWHWVKGHDGDPENECADRLARRAISRTEPPVA